MRHRLFASLTFLCTLLCSCSTEITFKEPEGYNFEPIKYAEYFVNPIDYENYAAYTKLNDFVDLTFDPSLTYDSSVISEYNNIASYGEKFDIFKEEDGYKRYNAFTAKNCPVVIPTLIDSAYQFRFYKLSASQQFKLDNGPYHGLIDVVNYQEFTGFFLWSMSFEILPLINQTKDFPYDVYFRNESYFTDYKDNNKTKLKSDFVFIPKENKFSRKCIDKMNNAGIYHYFDFETMNLYLKGVK